MEGLGVLDTTDEGGLGVNVSEEFLGGGLRGFSGKGGGGGDLLLELSIDGLKLLLSGELVLEETSADESDGIAGIANLLNLSALTVRGSRIGHGVTDITVGLGLEQDGTVSLGVLDGEATSVTGSDNVHTVELESRDVVTTSVELRGGRSTVNGGSHGVLVVLDDVDDGQVPDLGHVVSLVDLTLVGSSISHVGHGDGSSLGVLGGKGETSSDGDLGSDDTVSSVEVLGDVVHVHRTSLTLGGTGLTTSKLSKDFLGSSSSAARNQEGVLTVGGDHVILGGQSGFKSSRDGLLSVVQVQESTDLLLLVHTIRSDLHTANQGHLAVVAEQLIAGSRSLQGRSIVQAVELVGGFLQVE